MEQPYKIVRRPNLGKQGRSVGLFVNYYPVDFQDTNFYLYDISIQPEVKLRTLSRYLVARARATAFPHIAYAYDGQKLMFTPAEIDVDTSAVQVEVTPEQSDAVRKATTYTIKITQSAKVDSSLAAAYLQGQLDQMPQDVLQAMDVALRHELLERFFLIGRSLYSLDYSNMASLGEGLSAWRGHFQSIRICQRGLLVNIDVTMTPMVKAGKCLDVLMEFARARNDRELTVDKLRQVLRKLKGVVIQVTHMQYPRKYRIEGIADVPAREDRFEHEGKVVSVVEYFRSQYNINLRYPNLPCLKCGPKKVSIPIEVAEITPGQRYVRQLTTGQRRNVIMQTCALPPERLDNIHNAAHGVANNATTAAFGLSVDNSQPVQLNGRVLNPPQIGFRKGAEVPRDGQWRLPRGDVFCNPTRGAKWALVVAVPERSAPNGIVDQFCQELIRSAGELGLPRAQIIHRQRHVGAGIDAQLHAIATAKRPDLFLCVLDDGDESTYALVKKTCDVSLGIASQCAAVGKVVNRQKFGRTYLVNLAMKMNAKMGGSNFFLKTPPRYVTAGKMFFGMDVHHPAAGNRTSPSIAAVVGSLDPNATRYAQYVCQQANRQEVIDKMSLMVKALLLQYYKANNQRKPDHLFFYRDGVGEGQQVEILKTEFAEIKKAIASMPGFNPRVTFLLVQKRHHVRFFPVNPRDGDRNGNVLAGTVVDTDICSPVEFDFYMCSHASLKGTARPAHYTVVFDDSGISSDDLQRLTFDLCHVYARCMRSVSIPSPTYYAHLAAYRGRYYSSAYDESDIASVASGGEGVSAVVHTSPLAGPDREPNRGGEAGRNMFYL